MLTENIDNLQIATQEYLKILKTGTLFDETYDLIELYPNPMGKKNLHAYIFPTHAVSEEFHRLIPVNKNETQKSIDAKLKKIHKDNDGIFNKQSILLISNKRDILKITVAIPYCGGDLSVEYPAAYGWSLSFENPNRYVITPVPDTVQLAHFNISKLPLKEVGSTRDVNLTSDHLSLFTNAIEKTSQNFNKQPKVLNPRFSR